MLVRFQPGAHQNHALTSTPVNIGMSFVAYIDESGDTGSRIRPIGERGSSRWIFVGAVLIRKENDPDLLTCADELRAKLDMPPRQDFHFHKQTHDKRVEVLRSLSRLRVRYIVVGLHKELLPELLTGREKLYFYAARLLLERISWICRDAEGPACDVKVHFSERGNLNHSVVCDYLERIKADRNCSIHLPCFDPSRIFVDPNSTLVGLQMADAVVSGTRSGIEPNGYGSVETRYLEIMKRNFYRHPMRASHRTLDGYGLKFYPTVKVFLLFHQKVIQP
ncbi:MAG: DUF3800 domain-containing protein [Proteobacteria bacterium]|nr:MAG: DUF3800 domain-containing protein [Pseudomonadota bacterium]